MSGKYDIQVVMVPYWYTMISDAEKVDEAFEDPEYIKTLASTMKMAFTAKVRHNKNGKSPDVLSSVSKTIEYDATKVDTITVFEDFEFPYTYKNMRFSYPTLQIVGAVKGSGNITVKKGFMYGLLIDRVILRSKETGEETILDPQ